MNTQCEAPSRALVIVGITKKKTIFKSIFFLFLNPEKYQQKKKKRKIETGFTKRKEIKQDKTFGDARRPQRARRGARIRAAVKLLFDVVVEIPKKHFSNRVSFYF